MSVDDVRFKGARHAARIDHHVGDRIRRRRTILGYTQEQLADALDISYQQIQKYETGANRVSAGRLFQISQRLEVPINFFFDGLGIDFGDDGSAWANRATIETVRSLHQIQDPALRNAVLGLLKALSASTESDQGQAGLKENGTGYGNGVNTHARAGSDRDDGR